MCVCVRVCVFTSDVLCSSLRFCLRGLLFECGVSPAWKMVLGRGVCLKLSWGAPEDLSWDHTHTHTHTHTQMIFFPPAREDLMNTLTLKRDVFVPRCRSPRWSLPPPTSSCFSSCCPSYTGCHLGGESSGSADGETDGGTETQYSYRR